MVKSSPQYLFTQYIFYITISFNNYAPTNFKCQPFSKKYITLSDTKFSSSCFILSKQVIMHERHSSLKQTALESVNRSLKRGQLIYSIARFSFLLFSVIDQNNVYSRFFSFFKVASICSNAKFSVDRSQ